MTDLRELYQEIILDHNRNPRNFGAAEHADHAARGDNPLCGDRLTVYLNLDGDIVSDVRFDGKGCAISVASASMMTEMVKGKTAGEAKRLFHIFHDLCTGGNDAPPAADDDEDFERMQVLAGVRDYPMRVKCATLAWHTLNAALAGDREVSTE